MVFASDSCYRARHSRIQRDVALHGAESSLEVHPDHLLYREYECLRLEQVPTGHSEDVHGVSLR